MFEVRDAIVNNCKKHFTGSTFNLRRQEYNIYVIDGDVISKAISRNEVNVLNWFDNFWIYIEIRFVSDETDFPQTFLTISIFEGEADDSEKTHLFRAEWDSYENNLEHPQPHWHIYPNKWNHKLEDDFEAFSELNKEDGFDGYKIIDIVDMHFAMQALWIEKKGHIHKVSDANSLALWMDGILGHIKYQIKFIQGT